MTENKIYVLGIHHQVVKSKFTQTRRTKTW